MSSYKGSHNYQEKTHATKLKMRLLKRFLSNDWPSNTLLSSNSQASQKNTNPRPLLLILFLLTKFHLNPTHVVNLSFNHLQMKSRILFRGILLIGKKGGWLKGQRFEWIIQSRSNSTIALEIQFANGREDPHFYTIITRGLQVASSLMPRLFYPK